MTPAETLTAQIDDLRHAYEGLYHLMRRQSDALRSQDIDLLAAISIELQEAFYALGQLERERSAQTTALCNELSLPADATLRDIIAALDEPDRSRLTGEALGLRSLMGEAQQLSKQNEEIIVFEQNFMASLLQEVLQVPKESADTKAVRDPTRARFVDLEA